MKKYFSSEKGLTLIEILVSIVILSIIVVSFLSMFVQSSRSNAVSKNIIDATYIAEKEMEELYGKISSANSLAEFSPTTYMLREPKTNEKAFYEKNVPNHYILLELTSKPDDPLVKVLVKVFSDSTETKQEAQMEMILSWRSSG